MAESICLHYTVPGDDFTRAGEASADLKQRLKKLGIPPGAVRKVSIALYEGEINLAIHARGLFHCAGRSAQPWLWRGHGAAQYEEIFR